VTFTGATAKVMLTTDDTGTLKSIQEALERQLIVCTMQAQQVSLLGNYPGLRTLATADSTSSLAALDAGLCGAAVMFEDAWNNLKDQHCDKILVGTPLYSMANAVPVRSDLAAAFSWAISQAVLTGMYKQEEGFAKSVYLPSGSACDAAVEVAQGDGITPTAFFGPLLISFLCSTIALFLNTMHHCGHRAVVKVKERKANTASKLKLSAKAVMAVGVRKGPVLTLGLRQESAVAVNAFSSGGEHYHETRATAEAAKVKLSGAKLPALSTAVHPTHEVMAAELPAELPDDGPSCKPAVHL
jgi:hypothetical protein